MHAVYHLKICRYTNAHIVCWRTLSRIVCQWRILSSAIHYAHSAAWTTMIYILRDRIPFWCDTKTPMLLVDMDWKALCASLARDSRHAYTWINYFCLISSVICIFIAYIMRTKYMNLYIKNVTDTDFMVMWRKCPISRSLKTCRCKFCESVKRRSEYSLFSNSNSHPFSRAHFPFVSLRLLIFSTGLALRLSNQKLKINIAYFDEINFIFKTNDNANRFSLNK